MNPYPEPNSVIVLDNCSTHKSAALREVVEQSGTVLSESIFWSRADKNLQDVFSFSCLPTRPTTILSKQVSAVVSHHMDAQILSHLFLQ
jgi:hypothetical protein